MPEAAPAGIIPLFLREVTVTKFEIRPDLPWFRLSRASVLKEIQDMGKISDFEPARKQIEAVAAEELLFVVDPMQKYGETILLYASSELADEFMASVREQEEAALESLRRDALAAEAIAAAEFARLNAVYEDKPMTPRTWAGARETEEEIRLMQPAVARERISLEVYRRRSDMGKPCRFEHKTSLENKVVESRSVKDVNFKPVLEGEMGVQASPMTKSSEAQTIWFQAASKVVQCESASIVSGIDHGPVLDGRDDLIAFLHTATSRVELALQQIESVDVFHDTFRTAHGDDGLDGGGGVEIELRETKNFADPTYSKGRSLVACDWAPRRQDLLAVSGVRNVSFEARSAMSGQSSISYILLWDFKQLVRPVLLLESHSEVLAFRFNPLNPGIVAGGCISGQVVLWDVADVLDRNRRRGSTKNKMTSSREKEPAVGVDDEGDVQGVPRLPTATSNVDHSHNKAVADLFWLPATTQINYRGHLVGPEHLDGKVYQFVTVAGDGQLLVWDIRYDEIYADGLKHIGRTKHVPTEKSSSRDGGGARALWAPIFRMHLKRFEGVGEYSLCAAVCTGALRQSVASMSALAGDCRTHIVTTTEEGDILFVDMNAQHVKGGDAKEEEEDDRGGGGGGEATSDFVKWSALDQSRPCVALQLSPFFADVVLTVGDWSFHIWKIGHPRPLFVSPVSESYLTAGCWSPTRPAVLLVACADGHIMAWDFTDTSYKPSIPLKATQARITSMSFLIDDNRSRMQLLAAGDETGTLHIFELTRALQRPIHNEEAIMDKFLDRELQRQFNRHELSHDSRGSAAGSTPSFTVDQQAVGSNALSEASAKEEAKRMELQQQKKEDDEFLRLEQTFITDLGITHDLPQWLTSESPVNQAAAADAK